MLSDPNGVFVIEDVDDDVNNRQGPVPVEAVMTSSGEIIDNVGVYVPNQIAGRVVATGYLSSIPPYPEMSNKVIEAPRQGVYDFLAVELPPPENQ